MPRRARLSLPGIVWHIVQRGNNRTDCFHTDADFIFYLEHLGRLSEKFRCAVHAYVLMANHVHLLLTPEERESAPALMKHLGQCYAQYANRSYGRSGTLWEGRFRSCLMQGDANVLACYRYIELNPVRAGIVTAPDQYVWSSYRSNAIGEIVPWLRPHKQYLLIGPDREARVSSYRHLFDLRLEEEWIAKIRRATNGNYALGDQRFEKRIERLLGQRAAWRKPGRPAKAESST
jgi:putative transposase